MSISIPNNQEQHARITAMVDSLKKEFYASKTQQDAIVTEVRGLDRDRQYKVCSLVKAQKTEQAYRDINNMVTINASREAGLIKAQTKQLATDSTALGTSVQNAVKKMKELREKLKAVHAEACNLKSSVAEEQSCNLQLYEAIKAEANKNKAGSIGGKRQARLEFDQTINHIHHQTERLQELAMTAFSTGVDISGIQTFTYISSLGPLGEQLDKGVGSLKTDVDTNLGAAKTQVDKSQESLTAVLQQLSDMQVGYYAERAERDGLKPVIIYAQRIGTGEMHCAPAEERRAKIHDICEKVNDIFTENVDNAEEQEEKENWDMPDEKDMGKEK